MEKSVTTAGESIIGPVSCTNHIEDETTGPLAVEFKQ